MNCDLCNRTEAADKLLCAVCPDMIRRLVIINNRMTMQEVCEADHLGAAAAASRGDAVSSSASIPIEHTRAAAVLLAIRRKL